MATALQAITTVVLSSNDPNQYLMAPKWHLEVCVQAFSCRCQAHLVQRSQLTDIQPRARDTNLHNALNKKEGQLHHLHWFSVDFM